MDTMNRRTTHILRAARLPAGCLLALAPALARASEEAAGGGGNPLTQFNPGLLIWTTLTFILLVLLLWWKAWPSIVGALTKRESAVRDAIAQARQDREQAEKLLQEHRDLVAQARRETAALVDQGRRDAEKVRGEILDKARSEQQEFLEQGRRQIENETRAAIAGLRATAVDLALAASEKLLKRTLDGDTHRRLVEETLEELSDTGGGTPSA